MKYYTSMHTLKLFFISLLLSTQLAGRETGGDKEEDLNLLKLWEKVKRTDKFDSMVSLNETSDFLQKGDLMDNLSIDDGGWGSSNKLVF